ncbi:MAG: SxtJ family membrane protein [Calditrichaceae bacterium]
MIKDISEEFKQLDVSNRKLKQFAYLIGAILLLISVWNFIKYNNHDWTIVTGLIAIVLFVIALIRVKILAIPYKIWMGIAIILGWFVSRIILAVVFYLTLTPISLLGRLLKKKWMDINFTEKKDSYWISRNTQEPVNYDKMY